MFVAQAENRGRLPPLTATSAGNANQSIDITAARLLDLQADAAVVCADGEIHVTLTNVEGAEPSRGDRSASTATSSSTVTVPAGAGGGGEGDPEAVVVAIPVDENTTYDVLVEAGGVFSEVVRRHRGRLLRRRRRRPRSSAPRRRRRGSSSRSRSRWRRGRRRSPSPSTARSPRIGHRRAGAGGDGEGTRRDHDPGRGGRRRTTVVVTAEDDGFERA